MSRRVQVILDEEDRELFREAAAREGVPLSAWLREAGREKLGAQERLRHVNTIKGLRAFFAACDRREEGVESDWEEHRSVIERSIRSGQSGT
ncbi:MAG: hypothetical protein ACRD1X_08710 [Vicinamibacteria bacterium]